MKREGVLLAVALALSGCAISSKTYGPDGREAHSINCSGAALSWGECFAKAGDICGAKGYEVVSRSSDQNGVLGAGGGGLFGSYSQSRSLVVSCKA